MSTSDKDLSELRKTDRERRLEYTGTRVSLVWGELLQLHAFAESSLGEQTEAETQEWWGALEVKLRAALERCKASLATSEPRDDQ